MAGKPWRTLHVGEDTGRFTREQIRAAVVAVKARKEAKRMNGGRSPSKNEASTSVADKGPATRNQSTVEP